MLKKRSSGRWKARVPQLLCTRGSLAQLRTFTTMAATAAEPAAAAPLGGQELRAVFDKALLEQNYGERCRQLACCGRSAKGALDQARTAAAAAGETGSSPVGLEQLLGPLPSDTFSSLAALLVAKNAGCTQTPVNLLTHASTKVRYKACTMLQASDAERVFLSGESNKQLKGWVLKSCPTLPCTDATMEQAMKMDAGPWDMLWRTTDSAFLQEWLPMCNVSPFSPFLHIVADRHPDVVLKFLGDRTVSPASSCGCWPWVLALAKRRPRELLHKVLVSSSHCLVKRDGALCERLVEWAWRHQHEEMLAICQQKLHMHVHKELGNNISVPWLIEWQQVIATSHSRPTVNRKIDTIVTVFTGAPAKLTSMSMLSEYVALLPSNIHEHRSKELRRLVDGYWKMVGKLGRGQLFDVQKEGVFNTMARKLPEPLAVEQFFRVLKEVELRLDDYLFMLSEICLTRDGKHDNLMQEVFERFLQRDEDPHNVVRDGEKMFRELVRNAKSMDVIQSCFDIVTQRLGAKVGRNLLWDTVEKMKALDQQLTEQKQSPASDDVDEWRPNFPAHTKPLPTEWMRFILSTEKAPPHVSFLHGTLAVWNTNRVALNALVSRFGTKAFWDTLSHVLAHALGHGFSPPSRPQPSDFSDMGHIADVMLVPQQSENADLPKAAGDAAPMLKGVYFTRLEQKKQRTFGRDMGERTDAYHELILDAVKDCNVGDAIDDLIPFLLQRLGGEQENIMADVMHTLFGRIPVEHLATRLEMLRSLRKVWNKARGQMSPHMWETLGQNMIWHSLRSWKKDQEAPDEACLFGAEIAGSGYCFPGAYERLVAQSLPIPMHAVRWLLESSAPLPQKQATAERRQFVDQPDTQEGPSMFLKALARMAHAHGKTERWAWEQWPFVEQWWIKLLESGITHPPRLLSFCSSTWWMR